MFSINLLEEISENDNFWGKYCAPKTGIFRDFRDKGSDLGTAVPRTPGQPKRLVVSGKSARPGRLGRAMTDISEQILNPINGG